MLENSFVHLPGIGPETEERFWSEGLCTWDQLAENVTSLFGQKKAQSMALAISECRAASANQHFEYFHGRFKGSEMWRLLPTLLENPATNPIAYLDIETTGLGFPPQCKSTTIAIYFRGQLHLEYKPAQKLALLKYIDEEAKCLVTFNGGTFDLPFLRREFALKLTQSHVDLRFWLARLGYRGGLKLVQKSFSNIHQRTSLDIDGFDAVRLWQLHERGVPNALETLFTYNAEDTLILEQLIYCALNLETERRPALNLKTYSFPTLPQIPYTVCPHIYRMLRK